MSTLSISSKLFEYPHLLEKFCLSFSLNFPTISLNLPKFLEIFMFNEEDDDFEEDDESNYLEQFGEYDEYDDFDEDDFDEDEELQSFDDEFGKEHTENNEFHNEFDDDFDDDLIDEFKGKEEVIDKGDIEASEYEDDSLTDIIDSDTIEDDDYFYGEYDE